jgi:hypothetical protein
MKRDEALALLKELMIVCETMRFAPVVSLTPSPTPGRWRLHLKWADNQEKGCFEKLIQERGLKATETADGYTIFLKS